jgi:hypothetical protein
MAMVEPFEKPSCFNAICAVSREAPGGEGFAISRESEEAGSQLEY